jgi:hypothetical protein
MLLGVGDEVGREVAAVELHALDDSSSVSRSCLFDGDDAVLADLVHRLGDELADLASPLAEMVPTCAISSPLTGLRHLLELSTTRSTALSMPRLRSIGFAPAGDVLDALAEDRLREHGRGGRAVAGDVGGLEATSFTICAPMFSSGSLSSISLATVTPSLVMVGRAELLVEDDVAALGAERDLDRVGELVDACTCRRARGRRPVRRAGCARRRPCACRRRRR